MKSRVIKIVLLYCLFLTAAFINADSYAHDSDPMTGVSDEMMVLRKETAHFSYYCRKADEKCLKDLAASLEQNYARITSDLKYEPGHRVKVYVYKDLKTFRKAIGVPFAPDWVVGAAVDNTVKMVSPINPREMHRYAHFMKTVNHEFVHALLNEITTQTGNIIPLWLHEGVAVYESKQAYMLKGIRQLVKDSRIPALDSITDYTSYDEMDENNAYTFSYTLVAYIIDKYGVEALEDFIRTPDFQKVFGIDKAEFEKSWHKFLKEHY